MGKILALHWATCCGWGGASECGRRVGLGRAAGRAGPRRPGPAWRSACWAERLGERVGVLGRSAGRSGRGGRLGWSSSGRGRRLGAAEQRAGLGGRRGRACRAWRRGGAGLSGMVGRGARRRRGRRDPRRGGRRGGRAGRRAGRAERLADVAERLGVAGWAWPSAALASVGGGWAERPGVGWAERLGGAVGAGWAGRRGRRLGERVGGLGRGAVVLGVLAGVALGVLVGAGRAGPRQTACRCPALRGAAPRSRSSARAVRRAVHAAGAGRRR